MRPWLAYTLARLGLLAAVIVALLPVPGLHLGLKLLAALLVSAVLSWFLLRRLRDRAAVELARRMDRRWAERERLRAALAGEDDPGDGAPGHDDPGHDDPGDDDHGGNGPGGSDPGKVDRSGVT